MNSLLEIGIENIVEADDKVLFRVKNRYVGAGAQASSPSAQVEAADVDIQTLKPNQRKESFSVMYVAVFTLSRSCIHFSSRCLYQHNAEHKTVGLAYV